jgi:hypothetical protein
VLRAERFLVDVQRAQEGGPFIARVPSPDGRYLALTGAIHHSTVWMVEGF